MTTVTDSSKERGGRHSTADRRKVVREKTQWIKIISAATAAAVAVHGRKQEPPHAEHAPSAVITTETGLPAPRDRGALSVINFAQRFASERTERTAVTAPPEKIGVLIDVKAEDLARNSLQLISVGDGVKINLVPNIDTGITYSREYRVSNKDPLGSLKPSARVDTIISALEQCRRNVREGRSAYVSEIPEAEKKMYSVTVPNIEEDSDPSHAVTVADVSKNDQIVLRVDLGAEHSSGYLWLQNLINTSDALVKEIDAQLGSTDPFVSFIKSAVTDPKNGHFDKNAKICFERLFSLTRKDRMQLSQAIGNNDINRAREILLNRAADAAISEDIYKKLLRYAQISRDNHISKEDVGRALSEYYTKEFSQGETQEDKVTAESLLSEVLSDRDLDAISALSSHTFEVLQESIVANSSPSYTAFQRILSDRLSNSSDEAISNIIPEHTLRAIQQNLQQLLGSESVDGWLDSTDRERNVLSLMALLEQRSELLDISANAMSGSKPLLKRMIEHKDGKVYLLLQLQAGKGIQLSSGDMISNNIYLSMLAEVMRAFVESRILLGMYDGANRPLNERVSEYFAHEGHRPEFIASKLLSPYQLFKLLELAPSPLAEMRGASMDVNGKKANVVLGEPVNSGMVMVRDINRTRTHSEAVVGGEVHLPASDARPR